MCFSEKASFIAAGTLAAISGACVYSTRLSKNYIALALVPLFFALQQAAEGVEWLVFKELWGTTREEQLAIDLFVFIAYVLWPFWIPFSLWLAEKDSKRRTYLGILLCIGLALAIHNGWNVMTHAESAYVQNKSIYYYVSVDQIFIWPYLLAIITPWFISSLPYTSWLGLFIMASAAISAYFYYFSFASVWCFFAAFISIFILLILRKQMKRRPSI